MVSPVLPLYSPRNGRGYSSRPFPTPLGYSERHVHSSPYDTRSVTMADQQLDSDSAPQRKRIAVACGRCRKRKIRCSGDPGTGQPCQNCKNAGVEECLFLRVQSREAPMRVEPEEFNYTSSDARMYASRAGTGGVNSSMGYAQNLPTLSSADVVASYRGSTYPQYTHTASRPYFPAYAPSYADDFDYSLGVSSHPVLNHDAVGLVPSHHHWSSRAKQAADSGYGSIMLATDPSSYTYSSTNLIHRPAVSPESNNFSFSGVAASLPSTSGMERLLPNPVARASTLPYPGTLKAPASTATPPPAATLVDVAAAAAAATYSSNYDTSGLPYHSSPNAVSSSSHHHPQVSRADTYSGSETIFGDQARNLQNQGTGFELQEYTAEPRRDSVSTGGHSSSSVLSNGQTYVPSDSGPHDTHPLPHHTHTQTHVAGYMTESPISAGPQGHRHSQSRQSHSHHHTSAGSAGSTSHADTLRTAVASRH